MGRKPGATVDEKRKIVALKGKGLSVVEIAKKLNRRRPFIHKVLRDPFFQDQDRIKGQFVELRNMRCSA